MSCQLFIAISIIIVYIGNGYCTPITNSSSQTGNNNIGNVTSSVPPAALSIGDTTASTPVSLSSGVTTSSTPVSLSSGVTTSSTPASLRSGDTTASTSASLSSGVTTSSTSASLSIGVSTANPTTLLSSKVSTKGQEIPLNNAVLYNSNKFPEMAKMAEGFSVLMSAKLSSTFNFEDKSCFEGISICYNVNHLHPLMNNINTPWFVCPWGKKGYQYCCGYRGYQYCCRYFDRPGVLAALVIGILVFILILLALLFRHYKKKKSRMQSTVSIQYIAEKSGLDVMIPDNKCNEFTNLPAPPYEKNGPGVWAPPDYCDVVDCDKVKANQFDFHILNNTPSYNNEKENK